MAPRRWKLRIELPPLSISDLALPEAYVFKLTGVE